MSCPIKCDRRARLRHIILLRDGEECALCGGTMAENDRSIDHIVPRAQGGTNEQANLQLTHLACNNARDTMSLAKWVEYYIEQAEMLYYVELYAYTSNTFKVAA
jgi:hypothetical protein